MNKRIIVLISVILLFSNCVTSKYKQKGFVTNKEYSKEISFEYINGFIFIPVTIENKEYKFLLDTGAELNLIDPKIANQLNLKPLKKGTISNAKESEKRISRVEISNINIGGIDFHQTAGIIWDISKFSDLIGCVKIDGLIGNNLMRKSNWQINYQNKTIKISDKIDNFNISSNVKKTIMNSGNYGNVIFDVTIRDKTKRFTFDTGFNGFMQTGETDILENEKYLTQIGLTGANFNGKKDGETYYNKLETFSLNGIEFKSPKLLSVKTNSSSVLGNEFYENFILTIDWQNDLLYFDPQKNIEFIEPALFEVSIYADYGKNEILVSSIYKESKLLKEIKPHSKVLFINDIDVSSFKKDELCDFWDNEWTNLKKLDELNITVSLEENTQKLTIKKIKNEW